MANNDLRITDAPEMPEELFTDGVTLPTGGKGNYSVTAQTIANFVVSKKNLATEDFVTDKIEVVDTLIDNHIADNNNPHKVTKTQIGLGNVNNTADLDKPVSNATRSAIATATENKLDKGDVYTKSELDTKINAKLDKEGAVTSVVGRVGAVDLYDTDITTWFGDSQDVKNKELISAQDFNAVGDGVTNDTSAFNRLELSYTKRIVDLLGKTYKVNTLPYSNDYINGKFMIGSTVIDSRGTNKLFGKTTFSPINLSRDGQLNYSAKYTLTRANGGGSGSVVQSFTQDFVNRYLYTLTATSPPFVCRYDMDGGVDKKAVDKTTYSEILGHQGLSVEYVNSYGDTLLWTSHPAGVGAGGKAIAFEYKALPELLDKYEVWTVLETEVSESITPSISADGRYMLFRFQSGSDIRIRVFEMSLIREKRIRGEYNISQLYLAEFKVPKVYINGAESVQDIACDGNYIYILWGTFSRDTDDLLIVLDFFGNIIQEHNVHSVGLAESREVYSPDNQHEPETLCFSKNINGGLSLMIGVCYGETGSRYFTMYQLGGDEPVSVATKDTPAFMAESLNVAEYCVPSGNQMRFGTYSKQEGYREHFKLDYLSRFLRGIDKSMQIAGTTNGFQWHSTVSQANLVLGRWAEGSMQYPQVMLFKSASNVIRESTRTPTGSTVGAVSFYADDGFGTYENVGVECASVRSVIARTPTSGVVPAKLIFMTRSDNAYLSRWEVSDLGVFSPTLSNNYDIGGASNVVKDLHIQNAPIVSSDERLKQQFRGFSNPEKLASEEIRRSICLYKFNDAVDLKGDGARWHVGVKAQQVISILKSHGLNWKDYGFICFDEWEEQEEIIDNWGDEVNEDGVVTKKAGSVISQEYKEAGSRYAVRYDELCMFLLANI